MVCLYNRMLLSPPPKKKSEYLLILGASQMMLVVKNLSTNAGEIRDVGLIPGPGKIPRRGTGNSFQYSCPKNPIDRGALPQHGCILEFVEENKKQQQQKTRQQKQRTYAFKFYVYKLKILPARLNNT